MYKVNVLYVQSKCMLFKPDMYFLFFILWTKYICFVGKCTLTIKQMYFVHKTNVLCQQNKCTLSTANVRYICLWLRYISFVHKVHFICTQSTFHLVITYIVVIFGKKDAELNFKIKKYFVKKNKFFFKKKNIFF